jgi:hypothetical protein
MTASKRPILLTWSATDFVSAMLDRSPTTTPSAPASFLRISSARGTAGVQHDLMLWLDQKVGGHFSEAVCGAGDEDTRHHGSFRRSPVILPFNARKRIHKMVVTTN